MQTQPMSWLEKLGVVISGFLLGLAAAVGVFLLGVLLNLATIYLFVWLVPGMNDHRDFPAMFGTALGLVGGLAAGIAVWVRFCWVRLRAPQAGSETD